MAAENEPSSSGVSWGLALLLGLVWAALSQSFAGFVTGVVLGVLAGQVIDLRRQVRSLVARLDHFGTAEKQKAEKSDDVAASTGTVSSSNPPVRRSEPAPSTVSASSAQPTPNPTAPALEQPLTARAATTAPQMKRPEPSRFDRLRAEFLSWLKRGNPVARIGIVILFFGAVFLAKYAADNSRYPVELRFISIAIGAFALLFIGWRLRDKRVVYAQLLQGGGIAGLYLTVFASIKLHDLLPLGLALGLMIVIAVAAAILAVAQNALSLAVIGTAGGFLAPVLVSTGGGNHIALFTYYAVLNLGVFVVAWFRTWRVLNVLGFVFTFSVTALWRATGYSHDDLVSADAFLVLFFLFYVAISVLNCLRQPPNLKGYVSGSLVFGLPVVAFTLHATLVKHIEFALAWSAFVLAAFYLALGWSLWRARRESFRLLVEAFAALGVVFASLAIPLAFDTQTTAAMWAVEGAGLLWLGVRQQRKLARAFGVLLQLGAGTASLLGLHHSHAQVAFLNGTYLGALMLAVSGLCSGYWLERNRQHQAGYEEGAHLVLTLWGTAWWLFGGLHEIGYFVPQAMAGGALSYVALTAILWTAFGIKMRWPLPQTIALNLPMLAAVTCLVYLTQRSHPSTEWGAVGWPLLFGTHYGLLYLLDKGRSQANAAGTHGLHAAGFWSIALVLAWESSWQIRLQAAGVWPILPWGVIPALFVALAGRRHPVPAWPLQRFITVYRLLGALPLAVVTSAWIVIVNATNSGDPTWLPYIPLFNPLDVATALSLATLALWWTSLDDQQRRQAWPTHVRALIALVSGMTFLWLNAALIRALHHNWGAPIAGYGMMHSTLVQAALSIFWGVLGFIAMTLAAKRGWRYAWMVGCGLMIVVVAKLFLIDLSSIGTLARITSFLTVGALMLLTGYLAPLPPKPAREGTA